MDTHTVIVWCPGKHRQVHCMQHRSVHTGAPSRCRGKGTHVEIQITWLHPHSVSKAMETGPWSGGAILVPRGAGGGLRSMWHTFQGPLPFDIFILGAGMSHTHWEVFVLLPQRRTGGRIKGTPCLPPLQTHQCFLLQHIKSPRGLPRPPAKQVGWSTWPV